jgi:hypothetical protein
LGPIVSDRWTVKLFGFAEGATSVISVVIATGYRSWDNRESATPRPRFQTRKVALQVRIDSLTRVVCEAEGIKIW